MGNLPKRQSLHFGNLGCVTTTTNKCIETTLTLCLAHWWTTKFDGQMECVDLLHCTPEAVLHIKTEYEEMYTEVQSTRCTLWARRDSVTWHEPQCQMFNVMDFSSDWPRNVDYIGRSGIFPTFLGHDIGKSVLSSYRQVAILSLPKLLAGLFRNALFSLHFS